MFSATQSGRVERDRPTVQLPSAINLRPSSFTHGIALRGQLKMPSEIGIPVVKDFNFVNIVIVITVVQFKYLACSIMIKYSAKIDAIMIIIHMHVASHILKGQKKDALSWRHRVQPPSPRRRAVPLVGMQRPKPRTVPNTGLSSSQGKCAAETMFQTPLLFLKKPEKTWWDANLLKLLCPQDGIRCPGGTWEKCSVNEWVMRPSASGEYYAVRRYAFIIWSFIIGLPSSIYSMFLLQICMALGSSMCHMNSYDMYVTVFAFPTKIASFYLIEWCSLVNFLSMKTSEWHKNSNRLAKTSSMGSNLSFPPSACTDVSCLRLRVLAELFCIWKSRYINLFHAKTPVTSRNSTSLST